MATGGPPQHPPLGEYPGSISSWGYVLVTFTEPGRGSWQITLQRLVAWHDSPLAHLRGLVVHHRNGDKRDNRPDNLQLFSHRQHRREHGHNPVHVRPCILCGRPFIPIHAQCATAPGRCCSRACAIALAQRKRWPRPPKSP